LLFPLVEELEVVLVSKLGKERAIVVIGNLENVEQPCEDDSVEINFEIGCSVATSRVPDVLGFARGFDRGGDGDGAVLLILVLC
jgi:hypothetical protein